MVPSICKEVIQWYNTAVGEETGYKNDMLETYLSEITEAADPSARYPKQLPACLIGDTGVGKSRLMGCLLACHKLATTVGLL